MYFREVTEEQARARNLLISIAKGLHNEDEIGGRYMIDEIRTRFYFSKRDIKYQLDTFLTVWKKHIMCYAQASVHI